MPRYSGGRLTLIVSNPPDSSPAELLTAMYALPAGHPSRPALRERVIEAWLPLAGRLASRYSGRGEPTEDLVQTATMGLIKAVDKFDPGRGADFVSYAIPTVGGEIKRYFRDRTWALRVPRRLQELRLAISAANSDLTQTLGRLPTVADIAARLGTTEEHIQGGVLFGAADSVDGMVRRLRAEWPGAAGNREEGTGNEARVVATGGLSVVVAPLCTSVDVVDADLTLHGLKLAARHVGLHW